MTENNRRQVTVDSRDVLYALEYVSKLMGVIEGLGEKTVDLNYDEKPFILALERAITEEAP